MKAIVLVLAAALRCNGQHNQLTSSEQEAGFKLLFDGKTTSGWLEITGAAFPKSWTIEDGSLKAVAGLPGFQDLRTVGEYGDFELRFTWKVEAGGNSGVKYRLDKVDRWKTLDGASYHARAQGLEYQIVDDSLNPEAKSDAKNTAGSLYGKIAPTRAAARPAGEWNESRLLLRGTHVEHWLNGVKVVECECAGPRKASAIALQNHNSVAWFRDLRILDMTR
jgi:hypothetical protein